MPLNPNQFKQDVVAGQQDLSFVGSVVSCQVKTGESTALVAGQSVKIVDSAGGVPKVTARAANTDGTFGVIIRNLKDQTFPAESAVEVGLKGTVVYLTAGAAIARGAAVEINYDDDKVIANAGVNPVVGFAYDKAAADGDLIRVYLECPAVPSTLAQLSDVTITTPADTEVLKYDTGVWVNGTDAT